MARHATRHFLGSRLRSLRDERKITQEDLARAIDVRLRTIQRWEDVDGSEPSGHDVLKLSRALSCDMEWFYETEREAA